MTRHSARTKSLKKNSDKVDQFLQNVSRSTPVKSDKTSTAARLIFSLDATASRQHTWDLAMQLQTDMFMKTRGISALDVQLMYFKGYAECRASPWLKDPVQIIEMMRKVSCTAGTTQIERLFRHAITEAKKQPVKAMVFVGDCMEENVDVLGKLAGQLKLLGLPVFIFQEGADSTATLAFRQIAELSGGAHCVFDHNSAIRLGELLNAVAVYAAGGTTALERISSSGDGGASILLEQLK